MSFKLRFVVWVAVSIFGVSGLWVRPSAAQQDQPQDPESQKILNFLTLSGDLDQLLEPGIRLQDEKGAQLRQRLLRGASTLDAAEVTAPARVLLGRAELDNRALENLLNSIHEQELKRVARRYTRLLFMTETADAPVAEDTIQAICDGPYSGGYCSQDLRTTLLRQTRAQLSLLENLAAEPGSTVTALSAGQIRDLLNEGLNQLNERLDSISISVDEGILFDAPILKSAAVKASFEQYTQAYQELQGSEFGALLATPAAKQIGNEVRSLDLRHVIKSRTFGNKNQYRFALHAPFTERSVKQAIAETLATLQGQAWAASREVLARQHTERRGRTLRRRDWETTVPYSQAEIRKMRMDALVAQLSFRIEACGLAALKHSELSPLIAEAITRATDN